MNITMVFTIAYSFHWWALLDCEKVHLVNNFPVDICFPVHVHISFQIWATLSNWMKDDSYSLKTSFKWPYTVSNIILYCYCSVVQSCLTLWDPMDCSMPDFPVHHQLLELAQTHVSCYNHASSPCEDTTWRLKFRTCFSLEFNHAGTQIWAFRLQNYEKWISVVYNPPSLGYFAVPVHVD